MIIWLEIGLVRFGNIPMTACPSGHQLRIRCGIMKFRRNVGKKVNLGTRRVCRVETQQIMEEPGGEFSYSVPNAWVSRRRRRMKIERV